MNKLFCILMIGILGLSISFGAAVSLKQSHEVQAEFLRLSDFFENIPPERDQEILEAPDIGASRHYAHSWVRRLAQNFNLQWEPNHYKGITLTRQAFHQSKKIDAEELIKDYITQHYNEKLTDNKNLMLEDGARYALFSSAGSEPRLTNFSWVSDTKFVVVFDVGGQEKKIHGQIADMVEVPAINKVLEPGHIIQKEDLAYKQIPVHKLTRSIIQNESELIGRTLRRRILSPGTVIGLQDVFSPVLIKRGDLVTMKVETPNVIVTARGKAQSNGTAGQSIQVMNLESKRLVDGVVKDSQTVVIPVVLH